jgi:hypothetical protein
MLSGDPIPIRQLQQLHEVSSGTDARAIAHGTEEAAICSLASRYAQAHLDEFRAAMDELTRNGVFLVPRGPLDR